MKELFCQQLSVTGDLIDVPQYRSHKMVAALEIAGFDLPNILRFKDERFAPAMMPTDMWARYTPVVGDFYVVYTDGYQSFSPRKAFLEGYSPEET